MKKITLASLALLNLISAQSALAACATLWLHPGRGGAAVSLEHDAAGGLMDFGSIHWNDRAWGGHINGWRHVSTNWHDTASAIEVAGGCFLTVAEHGNLGGQKWELPAGYHEMGPWNDTISSARCDCSVVKKDFGIEMPRIPLH